MGHLIRALLIAGAGALLLLAGCSDDTDTGAVFVDMKDNFFGREVTRVPTGAPVLFVNAGTSPHNAVAADDSWSAEGTIGRLDVRPGEKVAVTIDQPGVYRYLCTFHGTEEGEGMVATLVVGDVELEPGEEDRAAVVEEASGRVLQVAPEPSSEAPFDTIQDAVDAARPGDLVLVHPGTYREEITVTTPSLTIRGTDRHEVVIDGELERPNGIQVFADGVAIENMTARNAVLNGFFWSGVIGYRGSYLTAQNNADYGIFAFDSVDGAFEHSYASGSPDSGFYIGQCYPCNAIVNSVTATGNALGYSGTNAGGDLYIVNSHWYENRAGIVPNTLDSELLPPERETTIAGNFVWNNGEVAIPAKQGTWPAFGNGILIAGGLRNEIRNNFVSDHPNHGILIAPNLDENFWFSAGNVVRDNVVRDSGRADLALAGPSGGGDCFEGNAFGVTAPFGLELLHGCGGVRVPLGGDLSALMRLAGLAAEAPPGTPDLDEVAAQPVDPRAGEQMPGGAGAPVRPAVNVFENYDLDLDAIDLPDDQVLVTYDIDDEGVPVSELAQSGPTGFQLLFNLYGYLLPFVLYAAWTSLAFWDLARREEASRRTRLLWIAAILLIPFLGVIGYHAFGRSALPAWLRAAVVGGGVVAYAAIVGIAALAGGVL